MSAPSSSPRRRSARLRAAAGAVVGLARRRVTVPGAVVLAYHDVLADEAPSFEYAVSVSRFRQHLVVLARLGVEVVSLAELSRRHRHGRSLDGLAAVVFDDAVVGVHHLALPELAARGWPATLMPVIDHLGVEPPWWPGSQRTMTRAELVEAVSGGVSLAAHGTSHTCLPCLPDVALREELHRSRDELSLLLSSGGVEGQVDELAYPFGHHTPRVTAAAAEAGFATGYAFLNGRVTAAASGLRLPRLTMHQGVGPVRLSHQLSRRATDWPEADAGWVHPHPT